MTREQAIVVLQKIKPTPCRGDGKSTTHTLEIIAIDMAIKALEQEPCEDAISRQAVLNILDDMVKDYIKENDFDKAQGVAWVKVQKLPPVTPQPKTGHWEWVQYDYNPKLGNWHCSECRCVVVECVDKNEKSGIPLYKYCPQCGAKMER